MASISGMVASVLQKKSGEIKQKNSLFSDFDIEILHHARFCNRLLMSFIENNEYMKKVSLFD